VAHDIVNEGSAFTLTARFFDEGVATAPTTARYRIRDLSNDRIVLDWTAITPATSVDITITATNNAVYRDNSKKRFNFEERVVTVQANYGLVSQYADEYRYLVKNLRGFES
jgi:hypothetical protein